MPPPSRMPVNKTTSAPSSPSGIVVEKLGAVSTNLSREGLFLPVAPAFLLVHIIPTVTFFHLADGNQLRVYLKEGMEIPPSVRRDILEDRIRHTLYVKASESATLLKYQEDALLEILNHPILPLKPKCRALFNLSMNISKEVHDKPRALNVYRLTAHIERAFDWLKNEDQAALSHLLSLTRKEYSISSHAVNVGHLSYALALEMYGESQSTLLRNITPGFFLHDVGKGFVRPEILNKETQLDEREWVEMKKHPQYGHTFLEREKLLSTDARDIVLQHHERADGQGYPQSLSGQSIKEGARLCSIVDAFDALTTRRTFRKYSHTPFDALQIMKEEMHTQFDPDMFKAFVLMTMRRGRE